MNQALVVALSAAAVITPFAAHDYAARHRITRLQREMDVLHARELRLELMIENVADCTNSVYPITFAPDGAVYLSFSPKTDRAFMPIGKDGGCLAAP